MPARLEGVQGVKRAIREQADRMIRAYIGQLDRIGMKVVTAIRDSDVSYWLDHTGNLRNSIGYMILHDGRKVKEDFKAVVSSGTEGVGKARAFAEEIASKYPSGIVLIIVAGMEYAAYVENVKSRTVLAGGEQLAKKLVKELEDKWRAKYGK